MFSLSPTNIRMYSTNIQYCSFRKISTNADISLSRKNLLRSKNMTTSYQIEDQTDIWRTWRLGGKKSVLKNPQKFSRNKEYGIMKVPHSLLSAKNRVAGCTSMRVCCFVALTFILCHIHKITTWWDVSVCEKEKNKAKQNKQIKKADNRIPFL